MRCVHSGCPMGPLGPAIGQEQSKPAAGETLAAPRSARGEIVNEPGEAELLVAPRRGGA
jgi:hypothetical protein